MKETYDAFISYSHKDSEWVNDWLLPRLEGCGLDVCIDHRDFDVGIASMINMERAVERSKHVIVVFTPDWMASEWSNFEALMTGSSDPSGLRQRILPIHFRQADIPLRLNILTWADFLKEDKWESQFQRVLSVFGKSRIEVVTKSDDHPRMEYGHKYLLEPNFTGRVAERKMLSNWFRGDKPVFVLEAMGGFGKSALTWVWMHSDLMNAPSPGVPDCTEENCAISEESRPELTFWWSFYEPKASFSSFLNAVLKAVSRGATDPISIESDYEKSEKLLALLKVHEVLLVFDGFERELREYKRINPEYNAEEDPEENKFFDEFSCISSTARSFLQSFVTTSGGSRILMTSRHLPSELRSRDRKSLPGCGYEVLQGLEEEDAFHFFRAQGINCQHVEFEQYCKQYGYHPLTLRLLSGMILEDPESAGDIKVMAGYDPIPDLIQRVHHVIALAYDALDEDKQQLLSRIAAFRSPMPYDVVKLVSNYESDSDLKTALLVLVRRGLLRHDRTEQRYDFHPLVKAYAYKQLKNVDVVHSKLVEYFTPLAQAVSKKVQTLDELNPVIELYHHTVHAGRFDVACDLYYERLGHILYYQLGVYSFIIDLLGALFPEGFGKLPRLSKESDKGYVLNALATSCSQSGMPQLAMQLALSAIEMAKERKHIENECTALRNLSGYQLSLGLIRVAEENLNETLDRLCNADDSHGEAASHAELGHLFIYKGLFSQVKNELQLSLSEWMNDRSFLPASVILSYQSLAALIDRESSHALNHSLEALRLWECAEVAMFPYERGRVRIEWLLGWSKTCLAPEKPKQKNKLLNEAEQHLTEAINRCRKINLIEFEPDILLAWARWHRVKGNPEEARKRCDEALEIADRCEYRLCQADIHNFIALLEFEAGDLREAKRQAEIGKERAYCDGPPYHYKPAYDESERLLKEIAAGGKSSDTKIN